MTDRLVLRLPSDLAAWVRHQATILNVKPGTAVRLLLEEHLNCQNRENDAACE